MESRASTRLGENVRLLTYVTIFFLPLSFCMVRYLLAIQSRANPDSVYMEYQQHPL